MIKAIIFDMDGVIIDSEVCKAQAWKEIIMESAKRDRGDEWYRARIGTSGRELCIQAIKDFNINKETGELFGELIARSKLLERQAEPIKSTCRFIESLPPSLLIAVASSHYKKMIEHNLTKTGLLSKFKVITSGVEELADEKNKPNPDIYLLTASKLGVDPSFCLAVEDTAIGVHAAKMAGMKCIGFFNKNSGKQDLSEADMIASDLTKVDLRSI